MEYYGNPKVVARILVKLIGQGKLRYNGAENYTRIIRSLASVIDVVNVVLGKIVNGESLLSFANQLFSYN